MASPAQLTANQTNALSSTGPRTAEGKAASSRNATSHGLSSACDPVLSHEDHAAFDRLLHGYLQDFRPATLHEDFLVREMTAARWRLQRADRLERIIFSELIAQDTNNSDDPDVRIARSMSSRGDALIRLERHRAALERAYHRSVRELRAARKLQNQPNQPDPPPQSAATQHPRSSAVTSVPTPAQNEPNRPFKTYVRSEPKIGRNDYCPCGSGLKFKKCCLDAAPASAAQPELRAASSRG